MFDQQSKVYFKQSRILHCFHITSREGRKAYGQFSVTYKIPNEQETVLNYTKNQVTIVEIGVIATELGNTKVPHQCVIT